MNIKQKISLVALNRLFYNKLAGEFDATRQSGWAGWEKLTLPAGARILDVGAGNLRYKKYLDVQGINYESYLGIDGSQELLSKSGEKKQFYLKRDVLDCLARGEDWRVGLKIYQPNFVLLSAFLHHVPGKDWRRQVLRGSGELLINGGKLAVSCWQFINTFPQLVTQDLGDGDYILSWRNNQGERYCHQLNEDEIETLKIELRKKGLKLQADFYSDGKTGRSNRWLVWEKK